MFQFQLAKIIQDILQLKMIQDNVHHARKDLDAKNVLVKVHALNAMITNI